MKSKSTFPLAASKTKMILSFQLCLYVYCPFVIFMECVCVCISIIVMLEGIKFSIITNLRKNKTKRHRSPKLNLMGYIPIMFIRGNDITQKIYTLNNYLFSLFSFLKYDRNRRDLELHVQFALQKYSGIFRSNL